jgi:hypothetical protein
MGAVSGKCFGRGGYGRIRGGLRALELAVDNREARHGKGARCSSTCMLTSVRPNRTSRHQEHEECGDGSSGEVQRRRSSGSAAARKPRTKGFELCPYPHGLLDPARAALPHHALTDNRYAHQILESASLDNHEGSHSK